MGGGRAPAPAPVIQERQNPYDDSWIHDKFATGQGRYDEVSNWMDERKAALAQPKYYDVGGGMPVAQDNFGEYFSGRLADQERQFNKRLADLQAQSQAQRQQMGTAYDARLADISAAAGVRDQRLKDITTAAGVQGQRLSDLTSAGQANQARLADLTSAGQANQAAIQAQQEAMARAGERARIQEAYGDQNMPGVTGVQTKKRQNLGAYGGTGGGFNRSGLRIQNLNI